MRRQIVGITAPQTPATPSKPVPLDTASLKKVVGGGGEAPHKGW